MQKNNKQNQNKRKIIIKSYYYYPLVNCRLEITMKHSINIIKMTLNKVILHLESLLSNAWRRNPSYTSKIHLWFFIGNGSCCLLWIWIWSLYIWWQPSLAWTTQSFFFCTCWICMIWWVYPSSFCSHDFPSTFRVIQRTGFYFSFSHDNGFDLSLFFLGQWCCGYRKKILGIFAICSIFLPLFYLRVYCYMFIATDVIFFTWKQHTYPNTSTCMASYLLNDFLWASTVFFCFSKLSNILS